LLSLYGSLGDAGINIDLVIGSGRELIDARDDLTTAQGADLLRYTDFVLADLTLRALWRTLGLTLPFDALESWLTRGRNAPLQAAVD
tara:strand:- start:581 stop:841 length:261 start_codon:yes stop_codon:yes gene_type:complete